MTIESSVDTNAPFLWVFKDLDGVTWPNYDVFSCWLHLAGKRVSKKCYILGACMAKRVVMPDHVFGANEKTSWMGHQHEQPLAHLKATQAAEEFNKAGLASAPIGGLAATLAERKKQHGDFTDHAACAQDFKKVFRAHVRRNNKDDGMRGLSDVQIEAAEMILHKLARIVAGDPNHKDHWDDIAGYATITSERIK